MTRGVAMPTITAAVDARIFSAQRELRSELADVVATAREAPEVTAEELEHALYLAILAAYSEGFQLISTAAAEEDWEIDRSELARIWQGGCIIRAELLTFLQESFRKNDSPKPLIALPEIVQEVQSGLPLLRGIVVDAATVGIPVPGLAAALMHLEQMTRARGSANFIQGLRDAFGAHTFARLDRPGTFHAEWLKTD